MSRLLVCDGDKPIYGITLENMQTLRSLMPYGLPFDRAMQFLKRTYEANKALSERPINFHDNVYNGTPFNSDAHNSDSNLLHGNPSGIH